ncbi:hypothetical protein ZWY2020_001775 [Hordeum vulgare]|nr:hypothetical protein ZWY2020_001775 [Hordeum vulgare]
MGTREVYEEKLRSGVHLRSGPTSAPRAPPQKLRARLPRLPGLRKLAWTDQKVWADMLQAVFPQQCQGHWLHQETTNKDWTD